MKWILTVVCQTLKMLYWIFSKYSCWYCFGSNPGQNLYLVSTANFLQRLRTSSKLCNSPASHYFRRKLIEYLIVIFTQETSPQDGWLASGHWFITITGSSLSSSTASVKDRKFFSSLITRSIKLIPLFSHLASHCFASISSLYNCLTYHWTAPRVTLHFHWCCNSKRF